MFRVLASPSSLLGSSSSVGEQMSRRVQLSSLLRLAQLVLVVLDLWSEKNLDLLLSCLSL